MLRPPQADSTVATSLPATTITTFATLLYDGGINEEQAQEVSRSLRSSGRWVSLDQAQHRRCDPFDRPRCIEHTHTASAMPPGLKKRDVKKATAAKDGAARVSSTTTASSTSSTSSSADSAQDPTFPVPPPFNKRTGSSSSSHSSSLFYTPSPHLLLSTSTSRYYSLFSFLTFIVTLSLYYRTAYPSVTGGDSGELIIAACNLGIAHPPGYPTFTLIAGSAIRLSRLLTPFLQTPLSPAYVVNLTNALLGSIAATFIYKTAALLTDNAWVGLMAAFGFAFSPTVWLYSIQGEVFALNNLLCAVMAYLTVRYYESESRFLAFAPSATSIPSSTHSTASTSSPSRARAFLAHHALLYAYLGALCCGLAMTNQHTTVFYVIPLVLFVLFSLYSCRLLSINSVLTLGVLLALGLSPYLYLPLRSLSQVMDSWGDQRTVSGFLTHFLRQEYGTFQLAASDTSSDPGMLSRLLVYLRVVQEESIHLGPVLAVWGLIGLIRGDRPRAVKLTALVQLYSFALYVLVFHKLANLDLRPLFLGVQARFWQQSNLFLFIWAACGVHYLTSIFFFRTDKPDPPIPSNPAGEDTKGRSQSWLLRCGRSLIIVCCVGFAVMQVTRNYRRMDHHESSGFIQSGRAILSSFPPNSIVLLNGDLNNNIIKYP